jgi:LPS sulfotransferase NodH
LLAEYLHNTGYVGSPEEYFRPDFMSWYLSEWHGPPKASFDEYLIMCFRATTTENGIFSAKVHWYQMAWLVSQLRSTGNAAESPHSLVERAFPNVHYVHLVRTDTVRQALSWYRAIETNEWFRLATEGTSSEERSEFPDFQQVRWLEDLILEHQQMWCDYFRPVNASQLEVDFDDFVRRPEVTVRNVMRFVGADYPSGVPIPRGAMLRQSDARTEVWAQAYRQVRDGLAPKDSDVSWSAVENRFVQKTASGERR